ncbi:MAG: hypothetical protein FJ320_12295 [SAR202 cluster bacterium]|nr:hypothetical protein [SAR202 cluster bacterium]
MALRLAGESYAPVSGVDGLGNLRLVDVNDASLGIRVNQRGVGRVFDFQDGGASVMYMDDGAALSLARDLAFSSARSITTTSGNLTLNPAGNVTLSKTTLPSSDDALDLGNNTIRMRTVFARKVDLGTSGNQGRVIDGNSSGLRIGADLGVVFHDDSNLNNEVVRIGGAAQITVADGKNVILGTATGTKIGTATTQKLGFYNATPVVQGSAVADASGGATVDAEARAAINGVLARLRSYGLIAT